MSFFNSVQKLRLARSLITKANPAYVQFYITSRCDMACEQCNITYATRDCSEMNISQIRAVSANFAKIGVSMVLLIGGEPFMRKDLPEIVRAFVEQDIHVRLQTNGLASRDMLMRCIKEGAHDISVSLDTLNESLQDEINGGFPGSWRRAIRTVAEINDIFPENGTAFFGTVLMPKNMEDIKGVLEFATKIGWGMSLVPVHVAHSGNNTSGFRTQVNADRQKFHESSYSRLKEIISNLKEMRSHGMNLYDCNEYLDDIYRFIKGEPVRWRRKNKNNCDSPSLYFALAPDGNFQPCCDYRLERPFPAYNPDFQKWYSNGLIHKETEKFVKNCSGCMYGSYPEITLTVRYLKPMFERFIFFNTKTKKLLKKMSGDKMIELAKEIFERNLSKRGSAYEQ